MKQERLFFPHYHILLPLLGVLLLQLIVGYKFIYLEPDNLENIFTNLFNRYMFSFIYFPLQIISVQLLPKSRVNDWFLVQDKKYQAIQLIVRTFIITLMYWMIWNLAYFIPVNIVTAISFHINMLSNLSVLFFSLLYCVLSQYFYLLLNNQVVAIIFGISIVFLTLVLSVSKLNTFFTFYCYPLSGFSLLYHLVILITLILLVCILVFGKAKGATR